MVLAYRDDGSASSTAEELEVKDPAKKTEEEGFEPPSRLPVNLISSRIPVGYFQKSTELNCNHIRENSHQSILGIIVNLRGLWGISVKIL